MEKKLEIEKKKITKTPQKQMKSTLEVKKELDKQTYAN